MVSNKGEIDLLDINPPQIKYSKYANNLDRIFKDKSLGGLQYNLKHPKIVKIHEFYEDYKSKGSSDKIDKYDQICNTDIFHPNINSESSEIKRTILSYIDSKDKGIKNANTEGNFDRKFILKDYRREKAKQIKKQIFREGPDPGKYNPNYSRIEKKIPNVIFYRPENKSKNATMDSKEHLTNKEKELNTNKEKISIIQTRPSKPFENKEFLDNSLSTINKTKMITIDNPISNKNVSSLKLNYKNNILRFSQYTDRKDQQKKKWHLPIISYIEPFDFISKNKGIDFKKMKTRNKMNFHNKGSTNTPSICYYEPKYDLVTKSSPRLIKFNHKDPKPENKHFLVQKMWRSYAVSSEYKFVNLKSFVDANK